MCQGALWDLFELLGQELMRSRAEGVYIERRKVKHLGECEVVKEAK